MKKIFCLTTFLIFSQLFAANSIFSSVDQLASALGSIKIVKQGEGETGLPFDKPLTYPEITKALRTTYSKLFSSLEGPIVGRGVTGEFSKNFNEWTEWLSNLYKVTQEDVNRVSKKSNRELFLEVAENLRGFSAGLPGSIELYNSLFYKKQVDDWKEVDYKTFISGVKRDKTAYVKLNEWKKSLEPKLFDGGDTKALKGLLGGVVDLFIRSYQNILGEKVLPGKAIGGKILAEELEQKFAPKRELPKPPTRDLPEPPKRELPKPPTRKLPELPKKETFEEISKLHTNELVKLENMFKEIWLKFDVVRKDISVSEENKFDTMMNELEKFLKVRFGKGNIKESDVDIISDLFAQAKTMGKDLIELITGFNILFFQQDENDWEGKDQKNLKDFANELGEIFGKVEWFVEVLGFEETEEEISKMKYLIGRWLQLLSDSADHISGQKVWGGYKIGDPALLAYTYSIIQVPPPPPPPRRKAPVRPLPKPPSK